MLELQDNQDRRLPLEKHEQGNDHFDGRLDDLIVLGCRRDLADLGVAVDQVAQHGQGALEVGRRDLLERLAVVRRQGGAAVGPAHVPEDGHGAAQQLHGHADGLAGPGAHGAEDGHHLELRGAVRHDVLGELDLAEACGALDHHDAALGEGAARRRLGLGRARGDRLVAAVDLAVEAAAQHLLHLQDARPAVDAAELQDLGLAGGHDVLRRHGRAVHGVVVPGEADLPVEGQAYGRRRDFGHRLEDRDRVGLPLDPDGRQGLVDYLARGVPAGLFVAEDTQGRRSTH
mmetsp:Transcript_7189/g.20211  ORF Transcript_7189/g.20211 Transcript_7189/m.20211 type:complete len:287 (-) Transcript_7189:1479-2339(-)